MNRKTYYHLVLDRSGSMSSCWEETLRGWTDQNVKILKTARENPDQEIYTSLCVFDDVIEFPGGIVKADEGRMPSLENIAPRGCTALFDAIGESIGNIRFAAGHELERGEASVVMVILTDGHENASVRYTSEMIRQEMDRLRETGLWNFVFIGADFDITATAGYFKADNGNRLNISKNHMPAAFDEMQKSLEDYIVMKKQGEVKKDFFKK